MNIVVSIIAFIFMLSLIVLIHEAGHFLAARHFGVYCKEFSIGMGPALYKHQGKETTLAIRAIPIGGYVMMAGEDDGSQDEDDPDSWLKDVPQDRRLNNKPAWQQIVVMAAGVFMNMVLALVLFFGVSLGFGQAVVDGPVFIDQVTENSPAAMAGIEPGDRIVELVDANGTVTEIENNDQLIELMNKNPKGNTFVIERDQNGQSQTVEIAVDPEYDAEAGRDMIGVTFGVHTRRLSFGEAIKNAWDSFINSFTLVFQSLAMLFQGQHLNDLAGPVGIAQATHQVLSMGFASYLMFIAMISVNIGIMNLLPLPALDGGRIVIVLYEKLFRRKLNEKVLTGLMLGSFILLFALMGFATWNDIVRLFA